ncbi:restriction endonuclease subunit S [Stutzerimonas kunmingensis]|uniref:restriction endonuclease subunit S n=1 Tax=Stutzerimonas kunmingensis TaxID=1211807 RepID=UPI00241C5543|nr:restriction endonuclease subunit S [Stutzerimonas kunmingensis]
MSELPNGWAEARIGDLADLNPKQAFDDEVVAGFVPMSHAPTTFRDKLRFDERPWGDIKKAYTNFKDGDVIFAKVTPCFENGKAAFVEGLPNGIGAGSSEFFVLRPSCDDISAKYLLGVVKSRDFLREGAANMTGAVGLRRVPKQFVESYSVLVPPAAEQTRIAAKLDELLAQVDTLKARIDGIPALLKRFRQSVLAAAVSGRLTEEWRAVNPCAESAEQQVAKVDASKTGRLKVRKADAGFSDDQLFAIPDGWSWVENHRLAEDSNTAICAGPFGTIFKAKDFRDAGVPIIFLRHVAEGVYKTEKPGFMDEAVWKELHQEYSVHGGELLVTKLGDPPGTACLYPQGIGTAMVTPDVIKMSVDERVALPKYLMFFFNSQHCKGLIEKLAFGATRLRIDIAMFKGFPIPLPPREEQTEIVRRVEQLFAFADQLEAKVASAKSRIDHLTQSILAKAFRGELVPQDPNDEPASLLLERIQAQRAATPKARQRRKV